MSKSKKAIQVFLSASIFCFLYEEGSVVSPAFASQQKQLSYSSQISKEEQKYDELVKALTDIRNQKELVDKEIQSLTAQPTNPTIQQKLQELNKKSAELQAALMVAAQNANDQDAKLESMKKQESFVQTLKEKGIVSPSAKIEKIVNPNSAAAGAIIFLKDLNSCPVVAKVFKNVASFVTEHKNLTAGTGYAQMVNELRKSNCGYTLPIITSPKGGIMIDDVGVILLEKAKGKPIADYIKNVPYLNEQQIKNIFTKVGEQFGALDFLFAQNIGKRLEHSDSHAENFMYDDANNQVYWIDTGGFNGITLSDNLDGLNYIKLIDLDTPTNLTLDHIAGDYAKIDKNSQKEMLDYINKFKKQMLARQSFAQGYLNKNPKSEIKEAFNNKAGQFVGNPLTYLQKQLNERIKALDLKVPPIDLEKDYKIQ